MLRGGLSTGGDCQAGGQHSQVFPPAGSGCQAARICLGGAFTKDMGQRSLVRNALRLVAIEGCGTGCATRMMQGVLGTLLPEVFIADSLCDFDAGLFGIEQMPETEIKDLARTVAERVAAKLSMA